MLERIKRKQMDGFKDFVQNLEITAGVARQQIFTTGVLEDPLYMSWIMKNLKTFDDFINLPSGEIDSVLSHQRQMIGVFVKCFWGESAEKITALESIAPKFMSEIKDELSYLQNVTSSEKEGAKHYMVKTTRKLMQDEIINGFRWALPPMNVFYPPTFKSGLNEIFFESGIVAAKGLIQANKRVGLWQHYYDNGSLLAFGDYYDGLKVGEWTFNYANGKTKAQGKYLADEKHGLWKEWDRTGELHEVVYSQGAKV
jgi:hypothetical protein